MTSLKKKKKSKEVQLRFLIRGKAMVESFESRFRIHWTSSLRPFPSVCVLAALRCTGTRGPPECPPEISDCGTSRAPWLAENRGTVLHLGESFAGSPLCSLQGYLEMQMGEHSCCRCFPTVTALAEFHHFHKAH